MHHKKHKRTASFSFKRLMKKIRRIFFFNNTWSARKKIRKRDKKNYFAWVIWWVLKWQKALIAITSIFLFIILSIFLIAKTIFGPRYTLATILIDPESKIEYNNPLLFLAVQESFLWKNYFLMRWWWDRRIKDELMQSFPHINELEIELIDDQIAQVTIFYNAPTIIFLLPEQRRFASFNEWLFLLWDEDFIDTDAPVIELPRYTQSLENIDGIFFMLWEQQLVDIYNTIFDVLWEENVFEFIYLPWWERLFVTYKWKRLFFDLTKDINTQLAKLINVENHYENFERLVELDLWSLDDVIIR